MITKSQKRHLKKVAKKKAKREERKAKQLHEQEGKFIWESKGNQDYSPEFISKAASKLIEDIKKAIDVRTYKESIQKLLLRWPPEYPRDQRFYYLKKLLDTYRDLKENSREALEVLINNEKMF